MQDVYIFTLMRYQQFADMSWNTSVRKHQREWCSDGPPEARNPDPPDWHTAKDEHPTKRARVCQQDDYSTPMEPTQWMTKRPPSPVLSCPVVDSVTSEKDLTSGQRRDQKFEVEERTCEVKIEEEPFRTGQQHSAGQYPEIKDLLTGWPLIDLNPEPIRCEDFDFGRCLYECLHHTDLHRWPDDNDKLVYDPLPNDSDGNPHKWVNPRRDLHRRTVHREQLVYGPILNATDVNPHKWVNPIRDLHRRTEHSDKLVDGPVLNGGNFNPYKWVNPSKRVNPFKWVKTGM